MFAFSLVSYLLCCTFRRNSSRRCLSFFQSFQILNKYVFHYIRSPAFTKCVSESRRGNPRNFLYRVLRRVAPSFVLVKNVQFDSKNEVFDLFRRWTMQSNCKIVFLSLPGSSRAVLSYRLVFSSAARCFSLLQLVLQRVLMTSLVRSTLPQGSVRRALRGIFCFQRRSMTTKK